MYKSIVFPEPQRVVVLWSSAPNEGQLYYSITFSATNDDARAICTQLNRMAVGSAVLERTLSDELLNAWELRLSHQWGPVFKKLVEALRGYDGSLTI